MSYSNNLKIPYPPKPEEPTEPKKPEVRLKPSKYMKPKDLRFDWINTDIDYGGEYNYFQIKQKTIKTLECHNIFAESVLSPRVTSEFLIEELLDSGNIIFDFNREFDCVILILNISEDFLKQNFKKVYNHDYEWELENYEYYLKDKISLLNKYEKSLNKYKKDLEIYNKKIKEWNELKERIDRVNSDELSKKN